MSETAQATRSPPSTNKSSFYFFTAITGFTCINILIMILNVQIIISVLKIKDLQTDFTSYVDLCCWCEGFVWTFHCVCTIKYFILIAQTVFTEGFFFVLCFPFVPSSFLLSSGRLTLLTIFPHKRKERSQHEPTFVPFGQTQLPNDRYPDAAVDFAISSCAPLLATRRDCGRSWCLCGVEASFWLCFLGL
jgi:hypothetical protein